MRYMVPQLWRRGLTAITAGAIALYATIPLYQGSQPAPVPAEETPAALVSGAKIAPRDEEEPLFAWLDSFEQRHGFNYGTWAEDSRRSDEETASIIAALPPEGEQPGFVVQYLDDLWDWHFIQYVREQSAEGCIPPGVMPKGGATEADCAERLLVAKDGSPIDPSVYDHLTEEDILAREDLTEIIAEEQLQPVMEELTGVPLEAQLELESAPVRLLLVYDREQGSIVRIIHFNAEDEGAIRDELDAAFSLSPRYSYGIAPLTGLSTSPIFLSERGNMGLYSLLQTGGHEYTHLIFAGTPVSGIGGEEGAIISETLAQIYGVTAAREVFNRYYLPLGIDSPFFEFPFDGEGNISLPPTGEASGNAVEGIFHSRYDGSTGLGQEVISLYNCIADPREAYSIFSQMDSADDVGEQLGLCQLGER